MSKTHKAVEIVIEDKQKAILIKQINDFLVKPVDMDVFLQRVSDLLSKTYPSSPPTIEPFRRTGSENMD